MGKGQNGDARGRGLATYKWMWWLPVLALYSYKGGQVSERAETDCERNTHLPSFL
jgi:hypothetical protein